MENKNESENKYGFKRDLKNRKCRGMSDAELFHSSGATSGKDRSPLRFNLSFIAVKYLNLFYDSQAVSDMNWG